MLRQKRFGFVFISFLRNLFSVATLLRDKVHLVGFLFPTSLLVLLEACGKGCSQGFENRNSALAVKLSENDNCESQSSS